MYRQRLQQLFRTSGFPVMEYGEDHFQISVADIGRLRLLGYVDQWKLALANRWFHVRLEDHSLLLFNDGVGGPSYSFIHCPLAVQTFREFLSSRGLDYDIRSRREHEDEYQLVLETAALRDHVVPIRFDLDYAGYREGVHPLAHVHIGVDNDVRLALTRVMSPESFALFVMRHVYPQCWEQLLGSTTEAYLQRLIRRSLQLVPTAYWVSNDQIELHLY